MYYENGNAYNGMLDVHQASIAMLQLRPSS